MKSGEARSKIWIVSRGRLTSETLDDGHVKNYWYYSDSALMATREQRSDTEWIGVVYTRDQT